jgi:hypothetical protein
MCETYFSIISKHENKYFDINHHQGQDILIIGRLKINILMKKVKKIIVIMSRN